ncbi:hypothetical protein Tco_0980209 [Tanacetum coccineum]
MGEDETHIIDIFIEGLKPEIENVVMRLQKDESDQPLLSSPDVKESAGIEFKENGLVDDVAVEAITSSVGVENGLVDDVVVNKDGERVKYWNKGCKVAAGDDLLYTNVKQKGNLEKATTCFAHMSSRTRSESSVSRIIKDTRYMGILAYDLEVDSVDDSTRNDFDERSFIMYLEADEKNGDNCSQLKFKLWKWPKKKKISGRNCKLKYGKWEFDI